MSKYKWDFSKADQAENAKVTEPAEIQKGLEKGFGPEMASVIAEGVQEYLKQKGVDAIDRRYLAIPEAQGRQPAGMQFSERDVNDATKWEELTPDAQLRRRVLMKAFFRQVLFGTPLDKSLAEHGDSVRDVKPLICVRTMSSAGGSGSEGGYLIPPGFIPYLVRDIPRQSVLFPLVTVYPTGQNNSGRMPTVATNATTSWGSEATAISTGDPAFGNATYTIYRHNTRIVLPLELVNDSNPAILDTVVSLIQQAMAEERDRVIAYGNGSGKPTGIYQSSGLTDVSGVTTISYANLCKILYSVDMRWHDAPNFRWTFNQNVLNACAGLVDSTGQPIWKQGGIGPDNPATLLGKRYVVSNSFPNNYIGAGDVSGYVWFDRGDMGAATDMGGDYFDEHQMALKVWERADGKFINTPTSKFARSRLLAGVTSLVSVN